MATVLLVLAAIGVTIYAAVDCLRSDLAEIRGLPKSLWLVVILAVPLFGGLLWLAAGRPVAAEPYRSRRLRTIGPDDDPDFLSSLQQPRTRGDRRRPEEPKGPAEPPRAAEPAGPTPAAGPSGPVESVGSDDGDDESDAKPS